MIGFSIGHSTRFIFRLPAIIAVAVALTTAPVYGQTIYDQLRFSAPTAPSLSQSAPPPATESKNMGILGMPQFSLSEAPIFTTDYLGRAAFFGDSTRMAAFAKGNMLPSAIPVAGQPFSNSGWRANAQGSGSAVRLNAYTPPSVDFAASAHVQLLATSMGTTGAQADSSVAIREAFGRLNAVSLGLMETAFADPASVPETLDLAGPNARITALPGGGIGTGQGRISYDFLTDGAPGGWCLTSSLEQPQPQIATTATTGAFSQYPDFINALQYVDVETVDGKVIEKWHLQFGTVIRNLGLENSTDTYRQNVTGWGTSLSGSYRFNLDPCLDQADRVMFSATYGQGISHYINDLNTATDTNDAAVNGAGTLVSQPVLAWYAAYTHNWTNTLRSTATYSQVNLSSSLPQGSGSPGPYHCGRYAAINLVFHATFLTKAVAPSTKDAEHNFFTGLEYSYGQKETLNGATGDDNRIMWVTAISK